MNVKLESLMEYANSKFGQRYLFGGHGTLTSYRLTLGEVLKAIHKCDSNLGLYSRPNPIVPSMKMRTLPSTLLATDFFSQLAKKELRPDLFHVVAALRNTITNNNTPPEGREDVLSNHVLRDNLDSIRNRIINNRRMLAP